MVNASSLPVVGGISFDLDSQAGVTQLLVSIRASGISSEHKNDVRDLVFQYTNGGRDVTVRRALEQKITALQITPVAPKKAPEPSLPPPVIGTYRVAPAFTPKPLPVKTQAQTTPSAPLPPPVVSSPVAVIPVAPASEQAEVLPVVEVEVKQKIEVPETPVVPASVPIQSLDDNQAYLTRIREIKTAVNEQVGNPVNLVDIDNEVGREYMSALLDAMKKLNSGSSPAPAMRRLEQAFASVEKTIENHKNLELKEKDTVRPLVSEPEAVPEYQSPVPTSTSLPITPVSTPAPREVPEPTFVETPTVPQYIYKPIVETTAPAPFVPPTPPPTPLAPRVPIPLPTPPPASGWNAVPTKTMSAPIVHSLAESEPPKTLDSLPLTRPAETLAPAGDILHTEEVNQGLEQLLLEWSLFKKSGLFGGGPKGTEHPLFKKVAELQIPLLLAGRFEGATQEIKQSITDYMNGWRYEQGIIYEPGELFEHYLRRVIRHILDLQKNKIR